MASRFETHTEVRRVGEGRFSATLTDAWNIGPVPNGGYQIAMMCRAAVAELGVRELVNVTCYFVSPTAPGPVELSVEVIKRGRTSSLAQVCLVQDGRERARALVLGGDLDVFVGPDLHTVEPPSMPAPEHCPRLSTQYSTVPKINDELELRLDPATSTFVRGETGGAPILQGWVRLADGGATDPLVLATFSDVLPPTTFNVFGVSRWVPTLELSVQIRRRPAPGWVRLRVTTRHITAGHLEEDGELWDEQGRLVAISRQRALLLAR